MNKIVVLLVVLLTGCFLSCSQPLENGQEATEFVVEEKNLYWGDLHNHNSIGQIKGSLERSYDIAKSHLDFFCFTPQSQWEDMVEIPKGRNAQFVRGFEAAKSNWDKMKQLAEKFYVPGEFVPLLGYEVHFNHGDFHIVFPGTDGDLVYLEDATAWHRYARENDAILIPHHPGYKPGWRGFDWSRMDAEVSPVVEICSEHGNAESDRSPIRYIRHSMGGRYTKSTVQWLWQSGVKAGVVASSDDHLGFPGAYGEGLAGVWADSLDRESIMEAIKERRTYGINADRIELEFLINGRWMGSALPASRVREISVKVMGEDVVDRVEVLKNNRVIHRDHPIDRVSGAGSWSRPVLCRIEFGWGPWSAFDMARVCDWQFQILAEDGEILSVSPHFQSRPFDEERRNRVIPKGDDVYEVVSHTSRVNALEDRATNDVVVTIAGSPETKITLVVTKPAEMTITRSLGELAEANEISFTGAFSSESIMLHRVVFADNYQTRVSVTDEAEGGGTDWYYVRVVQTNGSLAWSSPIWIGGEGQAQSAALSAGPKP